MNETTKLKPTIEDLKSAISAHRERDRIAQLEIVAIAAQKYLNSMMDGDVSKIIGRQVELEKAFLCLNTLTDEK